jgi:hypothetical protein
VSAALVKRRSLAIADEPNAPFDDNSQQWSDELSAPARSGIEVLPSKVLAAFGKPCRRPIFGT